MNLIAGRGGNETAKLRQLREGVGALRQALDIAAVRVKDNHTVKEESADPSGTAPPES
jgi:hypothetical protein